MGQTIGRYPFFFKALAAKVKENRSRLIIIACCTPSEQTITVEKLRNSGIPNDGVYFLPAWDVEDENVAKECPYRNELGDYGGWFWLKARIAEQQGVTHFVDEGAQLWTIFRRFLPGVIVHHPRSLVMPIKPASGCGNPYLWHCGDSPPYAARYGGNQTDFVPWQPIKAYSITFRGSVEAIYRAVAKWDGVVYTYGGSPNEAMLAIPASVFLADINQILEANGDDAFIDGWWEEGAHP